MPTIYVNKTSEVLKLKSRLQVNVKIAFPIDVIMPSSSVEPSLIYLLPNKKLSEFDYKNFLKHVLPSNQNIIHQNIIQSNDGRNTNYEIYSS